MCSHRIPQRRLCIAALQVLSLPLLLVSCRQEQASEISIQTVRAGTVQQIQPDAGEQYSATLMPVAQVALAFKSPGIVEHIHQVRGADARVRNVEAGDKVQKGTELARVRPLDYQQKVEQTQDQHRQAEAQLLQAEASFKNASENYTRAKALYESASLIKPDYDQAKAAYDSAQAAVQGARAAVGTSQSVVSQADLALADTRVAAPFTGYITARNIETGSLAGNSSAAFTMIDVHVIKAVFAVPDTTLRHIRVGQKETVVLDALGRPVQGVVTAISPQADPKTRVFSVEVSFSNPGDQARPGMIGTLTLGAARKPEPRIVVPIAAVVRAPQNPQGTAVFRIEERGEKQFASAQPVKLGSTYGNSIEVTGGVAPGDRIVAMGASLLRNGQEIRVLP